MHKVGFAFLVKRRFHNKNYLKTFFGSLNCDYEICVHSKSDMKFDLPFDVDYIPSIKTRWATPSLVVATSMLFDHLFNKGCTIVYLMSGDMIPLRKCKKYVERNRETTFQIQPKHKVPVSIKRYRIQQYNRTTPEFKLKVSKRNFAKQAMFFCMKKSDFYKIPVDLELFNDVHAVDEWFWVNSMKMYNLKYKKHDQYLYCNTSKFKTQALDFMEPPAPEIDDNFLFLRKINLELILKLENIEKRRLKKLEKEHENRLKRKNKLLYLNKIKNKNKKKKKK